MESTPIPRHRHGPMGLICIALLAQLGCARVNLMPWTERMPEATDKNPVSEVISIWEPSQGRNVEGMPTRGFAGQLFFFTRSSPTPVKVNGDVRVYVFDDQGTDEERAKPIHQFDFIGDAWTMHLQDSTLGPSYCVFIPFTRENEWRANCQLRLRLTPESGPVIYSDKVNVALPGSPPPINKESKRVDRQPAPHPVGQHLSSMLRPPVESLEFKASMRHATRRPGVVQDQETSPALDGSRVNRVGVSTLPTSDPPTRRRFRLASSQKLASTAHTAVGRHAGRKSSKTSSNLSLGESLDRVAPAGYQVESHESRGETPDAPSAEHLRDESWAATD